MTQTLEAALQEKYGLTRMEVDDLMEYMFSLCRNFDALARCFKTEHLVALRDHRIKQLKAENEKNSFQSFMITLGNSLGREAKLVFRAFKETHVARNLLIDSLSAHSVQGGVVQNITAILSLMSDTKRLGNAEAVITGRRAFDAIMNAGIRPDHA